MPTAPRDCSRREGITRRRRSRRSLLPPAAARHRNGTVCDGPSPRRWALGHHRQLRSSARRAGTLTRLAVGGQLVDSGAAHAPELRLQASPRRRGRFCPRAATSGRNLDRETVAASGAATPPVETLLVLGDSDRAVRGHRALIAAIGSSRHSYRPDPTGRCHESGGRQTARHVVMIERSTKRCLMEDARCLTP